MRTKKRIALANTGQKDNGVLRGVVKNVLHNQAVILAYFHRIADCLDNSLDAALLLKFTALLYEVLPFKEVNNNIIEVKHNKLESVRPFRVLMLHIFDTLSDFQFFFRWIVKNPVVDLVGFSTALTEGRLSDRRFHRVQSFC